MFNFAVLWTVVLQSPLSTQISRLDYWSGLPCPPSGDLPQPGIEQVTPGFPALAGEFFTTSSAWEAQQLLRKNQMSLSLSND